MFLIRTPQAYTTWQSGAWVGEDTARVPVQEARARNPFTPLRGRDGQRFPYGSSVQSLNIATPQLGLNAPAPRVYMLPRRYLTQSTDQKKPLRLKGFQTTVPGYTWTGLDAYERTVANQ